MNILCIDPGFGKLGIALIKKMSDYNLIIDKVDVIYTKKSNKKNNLLSCSDDVIRIFSILKQIEDFIGDISVYAIACEAQSYLRNAMSSTKVGFSYGAIVAMSHFRKIPFYQLQSQDIKEIIAGKRNASKSEIQACIKGKYEIPNWDGKTRDREHFFDAIAAGLAVLNIYRYTSAQI